MNALTGLLEEDYDRRTSYGGIRAAEGEGCRHGPHPGGSRRRESAPLIETREPRSAHSSAIMRPVLRLVAVGVTTAGGWTLRPLKSIAIYLPSDARHMFDRTLRTSRRTDDLYVFAYAQLGLALLATRAGDAYGAATMHGVADAIHEKLGTSVDPVESRLRAAHISALATRSETKRLKALMTPDAGLTPAPNHLSPKKCWKSVRLACESKGVDSRQRPRKSGPCHRLGLGERVRMSAGAGELPGRRDGVCRREEPSSYEVWPSRSWQQSTVPQAPGSRCRTGSNYRTTPHRPRPGGGRDSHPLGVAAQGPTGTLSRKRGTLCARHNPTVR